ncbi:MAG: bifunctional oligoribonuclease/PAP phosphatase NrnA [Firmicutes bacterium]|nr:bifunctional oligoribonuclease/PAP phosphatase NrnA [Bacillota bacterium]
MNAIIHAIKDHEEFIITSHEHPDPDSLGSMLGLYFGLKQLGKSCRVVSSDPPPENLDWPGLDLIEVLPDGLDNIGDAWIIVLDCEPSRTGILSVTLQQSDRIINIDHHRGNAYRNPTTHINSTEAATAVMVYRLLKSLGVTLTREIATSLYAGIVGDTGGFRYANTTAETLMIAAELMQHGVDHASINRQIFASQSMEFMKLLGYALSNLKSDLDGRLVWMELSYDDFQRFGTDPNTTDQLVQYARMVNSAVIAILFREASPGEVRVGFRSDYIDVGALASQLGGGGHRLAAGAKIQGRLEEVVELVLSKARNYLNEVEHS